MNHPNALDLEALAFGESPRGGETAEHVASCDACRGYVDRVRGTTEAPRTKAAEMRVAELVKRSAGAPSLRMIVSVAVPFAIAAGVLLWLARPVDPVGADHPLVAVRDPDPSPPDTRFKGGLTVAVVRERGPEQTRFTSSVSVRSGDRLRLEVALDRSDAILAAVLGDDGSFLELMTEGVRDAGMHLSERSARVDGDPTRGVIVVGHPEDVRRARATRDTRGLVTFPIEVESR